MGFERTEVERDVGHRRRQYAARRAARQIALENMAIGHAAAELVDQLACRDAGWGELDPGIAHPAGDGEGAQSLAPVAALAGKPLGPLLDEIAHPVERLDIVAQGRPAKEPDLCREGRPLPRQA